MFSLDEAAINATMDVIGRVALYVIPSPRHRPTLGKENHMLTEQFLDSDHKFNTQRSPNPMTTALRSQIPWCSFGAEPNPFDYMKPFKPLVHWYNTQIMNKYMTTVLKERYPSLPSPPSPHLHKNKAVIDLAHT